MKSTRIALSLVFFTLGAVFASWAARIPQLQEKLSISDGELGISMFSLAVGSLISMAAAAALGTKFGSALMTLSFSIAFCLTLMLLPLAPNWHLFSVALFVFGFAMGGQDVSMNAHAVVVEKAYGRPIMSSFHGLFSAGAMLGGALGSFMCAARVEPLLHFSVIAATLSLTMLAAGRILLAPPAAAAPAQPEEQKSSFFTLPDKSILALAGVAFCAFIGEGAISDWSAVYLNHDLHGSASLAAAGFSIFSLAMTVCRFLGDGVVQKLGPRKVLLFSGLIAGGGMGLSLILDSPELVAVIYLITGIGFSCMVPVAFSAAGRSKLNESIAIAGVATAGYFGFIIAPPIIGLLADHFTLRAALWLPAVLSLLVSALALKAPAATSPQSQ